MIGPIRNLRSLAGELALLGCVAASPWLATWLGLPLGAVALGLWLRGAEVRRERRAGALVFGGALVLLAVSAGLELGSAAAGGGDPEQPARAFQRQVEALAADAAAAAGEVDVQGGREQRIRSGFAVLGRRSAAAEHRERTYLLLDADDEAVAWSGRGLVHELAPERLPAHGSTFRQSATSASLLAVAPLAGEPGWRLVAGESYARDGDPPAEPAAGAAGRDRPVGEWFLEAPAMEGAPPALRWSNGPRFETDRRAAWWRRAAALAAALGLLVQAALRGAGRALLAGTIVRSRHPLAAILVPAVAAPALAAAALGADERSTIGLAAALSFAAAGWSVGRRARAGAWMLALGAGVGPALVLGARMASAGRSLPLSAVLGGDVAAIALRLALLAVAFGAIAAGGATRESSRWSDWSWGAGALLALAAMAADVPQLALPLLAAGGAAAARSVRRVGLAAPAQLGGTVLLAALIAGAAWVCGERWEDRRAAVERAAALLAPAPTSLSTLVARTRVALTEAVAAARVPLTESGDLAFAIWRRSPLARVDALSAVVIDRAEEPRSTFSFGLPLDTDGEIDHAPQRWVDLAPASWPGRLVGDEGELSGPDGRPWRVRWWLVPRLGFRGAPAEARDLAAGLLRGGALLRRPVGLPADARWAIWDGTGQLTSSAWEEGTPRLDELPGAPAGAWAASAEGSAWVAVARTREGAAAVFLPRLGAVAALERTGAVAAGALLPAAALAILALAAALPRSAVRDLVRRALRSYSKRLLIVFAVLLLVPVGSLYVFLSQTLERRIEREQEQAARAALRSVQRVLGEYVLTLPPGFGIGTELDDTFLEWLSRVTQHEVNLYWGSDVYASSKRDLFAAGLLPRRLPGEVWKRLALDGESLARRTSRAGAAEYLELYAPLEVPGQTIREARLVLSMPLLAQQEEAIAEAARLRRRALLATLALFVLLAATGTRLARRFTRPIEEIVAGTRRIAAGAGGLGFRPGEAELEALAEAIDRMAERLAEGREHLLGEKRLVERIVESVTAGVVGLDSAGRVLLANRAARDLLAVEPGQLLAERLAESPEREPMVAWLSAPAAGPGHLMLRAAGRGAEEREWTVVRVPLADAGEAAALIVVEDVTEVLRAQRLEAWAAMARLIAHEIKNPLTPIRLSTEHLREAWARDREHFEEVFDRCAENILHQVEELRDIASQFSIYSQIPRIDRQDGELIAAIREVVDAYRTAPPTGVEIRLETALDRLPARFDRRLLQRAVRNLIENAIRASAGGGVVEVGVGTADGYASIRVADSGPGVSPELLAQIFEPYFSTHTSGTGLGLPIASRIAAEHGGALTAGNRPSGGFEVLVTIPLG